MDEENKLKHIFWSPTHCFDWYQKFGDVVVFDTTYKVNSYDMPFGIFVGVDNHGRTILFGCALLCDETTDTFGWLMKVLLHKDCFSIPLTYWPSRWSRKEASISHEASFENATCVIDLIQCPPISKTKGRPKEKRMKNGIELAKNRRSCRLCKGVGHNFSTCSERGELIASNGAASKRASKKKKIMSEHEDLSPIFSLKL